jgi:hypothetical protein
VVGAGVASCFSLSGAGAALAEATFETEVRWTATVGGGWVEPSASTASSAKMPSAGGLPFPIFQPFSRATSSGLRNASGWPPCAVAAAVLQSCILHALPAACCHPPGIFALHKCS